MKIIWTLISIYAAKTVAFRNEFVKIQSVLDTHDVRQDIAVQATALEGTKTYRLAIATEGTGSLSLLRVFQKSQELSVRKQESVGETTYFDVTLPEKAEKGTEIAFKAHLVWIKSCKPFPKVLNQLDAAQMYEYYGNVFFYSPYNTVEQTHIVK
jgi:hypothetical protein